VLVGSFPLEAPLMTVIQQPPEVEDLRRQRAEAMQALRYWMGARMRLTRSHLLYPHVKARVFWWKHELDQLDAQLERVSPTPSQRRWKRATRLTAPLMAVLVAAGLAAAFPALLLGALAVLLWWLPWYVYGRASNR
jgi:hypothetical protein